MDLAFHEADRLLLVGSPSAKNFDLSRCRHDDERIKEMLQARTEGLGVRACARIFKMSEHTVLAIEEKYSSEVATIKKDLARDCRTAGRMAVSRMIEEMADMPKTSLPIIAGVMIDKMQVLEGEPSVITERRDASEISRDRASLNSMIEGLPMADEQEVIDLPPGPIAAEDARDQKDSSDQGEAGSEEVGK